MDAASVERRGGIKDFGMGQRGREPMIFGIMACCSKAGAPFVLAIFGTAELPQAAGCLFCGLVVSLCTEDRQNTTYATALEEHSDELIGRIERTGSFKQLWKFIEKKTTRK
jgi:hypothetical protein